MFSAVATSLLLRFLEVRSAKVALGVQLCRSESFLMGDYPPYEYRVYKLVPRKEGRYIHIIMYGERNPC